MGFWRHARVELQGDEVWVEDLGSTNGTQLNGEPYTIEGSGTIESLNLASAVNICIYQLSI